MRNLFVLTNVLALRMTARIGNGSLVVTAVILTSVVLQAFPPAPHHRFFGTVRNEFGNPIASEEAQIFFETANGRLLKTVIVPGMAPGMNYRLDVPMDAGLTSDLSKPTAMRPRMPFLIQVRIGGKVYAPIEMFVEANGTIGLPGERTHLDLTLGEDLDGDGLPDAWERALMQRTGLDDVDPNGDADGDGLTNLQEYISGNYAYDDENGFSLEVVGFNGAAPLLEFMAVRGRTYTVFASADLKDWVPTVFRIPAEGGDGAVHERYYAEDVRTIQIEAPPGDGDSGLRYFKLMVQ